MATHDQVAHAWAHQTGRQCNGPSMHYSGPTVYSYGRHFPIARHVTAADGRAAVLFTTDGYSNSTAKHKSLVRDACRHMRIFYVPHVLAETEAQHLANREAFIALAIDRVGKSAKARTRAASLLDEARGAVDDANAYAAAFALSVPPATFEGLDELAAQAAQRAKDQREAEEAARKRRAAAERLSIRDRVRAWMRGEAVHVRTSTPMVRVMGDRIETTWGASASLADALTAYRVAQACRRAGRGVEVGGPRVDHWGVASIDAKGTITVGCHRIPFRIAQLAACLAGIDNAEVV